MGSKVVIVRLEVPDAGEELSALELTWAPGTDQGMVAISSLSATGMLVVSCSRLR